MPQPTEDHYAVVHTAADGQVQVADVPLATTATTAKPATADAAAVVAASSGIAKRLQTHDLLHECIGAAAEWLEPPHQASELAASTGVEVVEAVQAAAADTVAEADGTALLASTGDDISAASSPKTTEDADRGHSSSSSTDGGNSGAAGDMEPEEPTAECRTGKGPAQNGAVEALLADMASMLEPAATPVRDKTLALRVNGDSNASSTCDNHDMTQQLDAAFDPAAAGVEEGEVG